MPEPEESKNGSNNPLRVAQLILTLNLDTLSLEIGGTAPNLEVALHMARRAVDECEFRVGQARALANARHVLPASMVNGGKFFRG